MRRLTQLAAVVIVAATLACGGGSDGGSSATITTVTTNDRYPFDATSAAQFPGTSLDRRLYMAQEVCDSIRANGDDYVAWLLLTKTRTDLVTFAATNEILASFSGLAVKTVCPKYLAQLQTALTTPSTVASSGAPN